MKIGFIISILCFVSTVFANTSDTSHKSKHSIFLEIGGNAPIYSFNYELQIMEFKNSSLIQSIGFDLPRFDPPRDYYVNGQTVNQKRLSLSFFPLRCNWLSNKSGQNHLELGLGATYYTANLATNAVDMVKEIIIDIRGQGIFLIPNVGYRFTPKSGFMVRANLSPYFSRTVKPQMQFYGGISLGYNFKIKKYESK